MQSDAYHYTKKEEGFFVKYFDQLNFFKLVHGGCLWCLCLFCDKTHS